MVLILLNSHTATYMRPLLTCSYRSSNFGVNFRRHVITRLQPGPCNCSVPIGRQTLVRVITHEKDLHVGIERQIYKASSHLIPQPGA